MTRSLTDHSNIQLHWLETWQTFLLCALLAIRIDQIEQSISHSVACWTTKLPKFILTMAPHIILYYKENSKRRLHRDGLSIMCYSISIYEVKYFTRLFKGCRWDSQSYMAVPLPWMEYLLPYNRPTDPTLDWHGPVSTKRFSTYAPFGWME